MSARILVVDDEAAVRFGVRDYLEDAGYDVAEAGSAAQAREGFRALRPDVAVLDYMLGDGTAIDLLRDLRAIDPHVPLIVLTAHGSIDLAVQAVKEGAEHFLTKPVELPALERMIERLVEQQRAREREAVRRSRDARVNDDPFLGSSAGIRTLAAQALRVAAAGSPVLIQGETGSGKGVLARWLHAKSARAAGPFVDLNCATLTREFLETELFGHEKGAFTGAVAAKSGLLEVAHTGTLFLDEIGDMDPEVQPKLLKVIEDRKFRRMGDVRDRSVDVRLVLASHYDLPSLVAAGRFRQDLYFRVSTVPLRVPPLRERVEDIPALAGRVLDGVARDLGRRDVRLAADAVAALMAYPWPGNVREMRNVLERALLLADSPELRARDLHFEAAVGPGTAPDVSITLLEAERRHITAVLQAEDGHVERTAARLGVPRSSLYEKLKRHGIPLPRAPRAGVPAAAAAETES